jgi:hypothetical protein
MEREIRTVVSNIQCGYGLGPRWKSSILFSFNGVLSGTPLNSPQSGLLGPNLSVRKNSPLWDPGHATGVGTGALPGRFYHSHVHILTHDWIQSLLLDASVSLPVLHLPPACFQILKFKFKFL